jgi:hypothetical protein
MRTAIPTREVAAVVVAETAQHKTARQRSEKSEAEAEIIKIASGGVSAETML